MAEACATTRSSDVALITSFSLTPPPHVHGQNSGAKNLGRLLRGLSSSQEAAESEADEGDRFDGRCRVESMRFHGGGA
jgi:hypothetical protein